MYRNKQNDGSFPVVYRRNPMRACGIIAEYNPFHNGHAYQLQKAKELSGADVMVVCMSGNFLQRGEPAIVDKWSRAQMALEAGADIVIELPVAFSVQPADYFARGAVALFQSMQVDAFSFGAESGQAKDFIDAAHAYYEKESEIDAAFQEMKGSGETYPQTIQKAIRSVLPDLHLDLSQPNNTLGFSYAKENSQYDHPMEIFVVPRKSAQHRDEELGEEMFSSATAIRRKMLDDTYSLDDLSSFVPESTLKGLKDEEFYQWEKLWPLLKYQLMVQPLSDLQEIYQMSEGIEYRLKEMVVESHSMNEFLEKIKSKRNTWTRMQRLMVYTLLQMKETEMQEQIKHPKAIHLLGFTTTGRKYLKEYRKEITLPVLSNVNRYNKEEWSFDIRAGEIYRLMNDVKIDHQDFYRRPIQL